VRGDSLQLVATAHHKVHVRQDFIVEEEGEALLDRRFGCLQVTQNISINLVTWHLIIDLFRNQIVKLKGMAISSCVSMQTTNSYLRFLQNFTGFFCFTKLLT
jgi:hypothetical protein